LSPAHDQQGRIYSPAVAEEQYVFSTLDEQVEFERLRLQERVIDWESMGAVMLVGLRAGARCLDAGVGAGSMVRWLASQVGPTGYVLGVDLNDRLFPASAGPNVELRKDDIRTTPLERESFDLIHCRALLMHLQPADRKAVLARFLDALRPDGWLVALDAAFGITIGVPETRANTLWRKALDGVMAATAPAADFDFGAELASTLAAAGFAEIDTYGAFGYPAPGGEYHRYAVHATEAAGPLLVPSGQFSQAELDELLDYLRSGEVAIGITNHIAWGRKPLA
jgi:SAM-dependent methyltransferase